MSAEGALMVDPKLTIPRSELIVRATRAGGPGGQHVNKTSTRVELVWNVRRSRALSDELRHRILERLAVRIDTEGNLRVVASATRSQTRNRADAEEKLARLVKLALHPPRPRRKTRPPKQSKEERLRSKRLKSEKKRERRTGADFD